MKRLVSVVITLAMLVTLFTACGSVNTSPGGAASTTASSSGQKTTPSYDGVTITVLMEGHPSSNSFEKLKDH